MMSGDARENHVDYVEFPAPSAQAFADVKRFYGEVFGWSFQDWGQEYADSKGSGITTGFSAAAEHRPAGTLVVLFAADLEATRERVIKAGGEIARDVFSFPGGRRFEYIDPAGNRLGVWSDR
jgi:predicted enzyme related to lactoylglutathione lyase